MDLDFIAEPSENRRSTVGAKVSPLVGMRLSFDSHRIFGKDCGGIKQRTMVFAAVEAMADADSIGISLDRYPDISAYASAGSLSHCVSSR